MMSGAAFFLSQSPLSLWERARVRVSASRCGTESAKALTPNPSPTGRGGTL
jgi:hypothetical protein